MHIYKHPTPMELMHIGFLFMALTVSHAQNISTLSVDNKPCMPAVNALMAALNQVPYPSDWKFIVVCDEPSWTQALRHAGNAATPDLAFGETFLEQRTTILRGTFMTPDLLDGYPAYLHITAHEMAHAIRMSPDEDKAEQLARQWLH